MAYNEITIEDITFRAVPFRNATNEGDLTLHIYCTCHHCSTIISDKDCLKLGAIIHDVNPEENQTALPFRLEPLGKQVLFVELPTRATSLRQGLREFYEAHQRRTAQYEADEQAREYIKRQRCNRTARANAELDQLLKAVE